ncbi:MAG: M81 family metallopeptidase [Bryobacteraceae bacterium]
MPHRVALGAIFTESNHLTAAFTDLACFERTELRRGDQVLAATDGVLGGAVSALRERGAEIVPLIFASAVPGGPLTGDCYAALRNDLLSRLREALPVDGVLMPQHGGAAVDEIGSLDGDLISAVREIIGPDVPLVATLDCHAHVTPEMVQSANALLAWETYPHRDTFTTGQRGARLLMDTLEGRVRPKMVLAKVPVIVGGYKGSTDDGPFADIMSYTKSLEKQPGVLSTSAFLVQPHLDLPGMGGGGLVVTDGDESLAEQLARTIATKYWDSRFDLEARVLTPAEAIATAENIPGTVLLLETSDCAGGGATGDSAAALRALVEANPEGRSLAPVVDPEAAALCHCHSPGDEVELTLGHKLDPRWGQPFPVTARLERLSDGKFVYSGGIWSGQTADMGPSAMVRVGNVEILITTFATYDWADEQYRALGMDPEGARFIVVKNPMNYRVGYADRFNAAFVLDTPGPTPASLRNVQFQRLARPYFPADEDIDGLEPTVVRGR